MDDPERRKRLEAIRKKKQDLQNQLMAKSSVAGGHEKSVDEIAKEALNSAKQITPFKPEEIEETNTFMKELTKRNFNKSLATTNFNELFIGRHPELYDEAAQCEEQRESDDSDNENDVVKHTGKKNYENLIIRKKHVQTDQNNEPVFDNRPKTYNVIPQEQKKDYIDKKKEEIIDFINKEKKVIERSLNERDLVAIFKKQDEEEEKNTEDANNKDPNAAKQKPKKDLIKQLCEFFDELCSNRTVTSLEWSIKHPELLLSSFSKADDFNLNQQNGLILLWSLALRKTPEFTFTCQAEITSSIFHTYNPKLIIGGTYTGQVLFWDTRGKQMPIHKTPLGIGGGSSGKTHSGPITCLGVIGSTNSNHVMSISSGALCIWSISNLSKPVKRIELKKRKIDEKSGLDEIGTLCMGLQQFETNNLLIGSDDNDIYQITLHGNENQSNVVQTFKGHEGPIYSLNVHPGDYYNMGNFSHLFISSSADWTTRLWTKSQPDAPLLTLDANEDYVYCSKWCPTRASLIACGDGSGHLDFWDFNTDLEVPKYRYQMGTDVINQLSWSDDGRRLAVGDSVGKIRVMGLSPKLYKSKVEDSLKFEKTVARLKMNK